jgi:predicted dehydrogenase
VDPAANILVEKPVCRREDLSRLRRLLEQRARGRIAVNENYGSSEVTATVKALAFERLGLRPRRVVVEMTKNRLSDFARGRFMDDDLGALGYEGSHMLAIVRHLGEQYLPGRFTHVSFEDAHLFSGGRRRVLRDQGAAWVRYVARGGVEVELSTSMSGNVRYACSPSGMQGARPIPEGDETRHRVLLVEGTDGRGQDVSVVGLYEPVQGLTRSEGLVLVLREGAVVGRVGPLRDDTMEAHLRRVLRYFRGGGDNPGEVVAAIELVELLSAARAYARGGAPRSARFRELSAHAQEVR